MENKRRMLVEMPIKVHSYDVDYMQIVNNTVYVKWFEDLRLALLDEFFPLTEMMKGNNTPILAETHVKYQRPVKLDSKPVGRVWLSELDSIRWVAQFEIVEEETVYCTGSQVGYYFNLERNRLTRFPEDFVNNFNSL